MTIQEQFEKIERNVIEIISKEELFEKLKKQRPLIIKYGADPSRPDLHLGHSIPLRKLKLFQDLGHYVVFIIGDFTGMIGDPTGVSRTRPQLSEQEIKENARTYAKQVFKILDEKKTKIVYNSDWFKNMTFLDAIKLSAKYTVARMLERDDFAKRYKEGKSISIHEFLYPLIQGYDSVAIKADIELGGVDQKFNFLVARDMQREFGQEPQIVITLPLLVGTDGVNKMSKSADNYIGIDENPDDMFGKIMSISDELMLTYYELLTDISLDEIRNIKNNLKLGKLHPMDIKKKLASEIVEMYHSKDASEKALKNFEKVFQKREIPTDIQEIKISKDNLKDNKIWICKLLTLCNLSQSNSDAKRLIEQGAVEIDGIKINDKNKEVFLNNEIIIKVGKRKFAKVSIITA